jgi:hypothetical protein
LREGLRLQFRAESFNAFNHPNFQIPVNFLDDNDIARVRITANEGREWQFALKLIFCLMVHGFYGLIRIDAN